MKVVVTLHISRCLFLFIFLGVIGIPSKGWSQNSDHHLIGTLRTIEKTVPLLEPERALTMVDAAFAQWAAGGIGPEGVGHVNDLARVRRNICSKLTGSCVGDQNWIRFAVSSKRDSDLPALGQWWKEYIDTLKDAKDYQKVLESLLTPKASVTSSQVLAIKELMIDQKLSISNEHRSMISNWLIARWQTESKTKVGQLIGDLFSSWQAALRPINIANAVTLAKEKSLSPELLIKLLSFLEWGTIRHDIALKIIHSKQFQSIQPTDKTWEIYPVRAVCHFGRFNLEYKQCETWLKKFEGNLPSAYLALEMGGTRLFQGKLAEAQKYFQQTEGLAGGVRTTFSESVLSWTLWHQAKLKNLLGNPSEALKILDNLKHQVALAGVNSDLAFCVTLETARSFRQLGKPSKALKYLEESAENLAPEISEISLRTALIKIDLIKIHIANKNQAGILSEMKVLTSAMKQGESPKLMFALVSFFSDSLKSDKPEFKLDKIEAVLGETHPEILDLKLAMSFEL